MLEIKFQRLHTDAILPQYAKEGDSGMDLYPTENVMLRPGECQMVATGWAIELPAGYEAQVRPRSGLAAKHRVTVLNAPGTVDNGYRGEVKVILINLGSEVFTLTAGEKAIAQLVIAPVTTCQPVEVVGLSESQRGAGGFGSTDKGAA